MLVDFHAHIFPPEVRRERQRYLGWDRTFSVLYGAPKASIATAEDLLEAMDRAGVDKAVAVNIGWASQKLCQETNDYLLEVAGRYPERIIPFCSVNPAAGEAAIQEVERCARLGARGIGELHPEFQGFDLGEGPLIRSLVEMARARGLPILTHASEPVGHTYAGKDRTTPEVLYKFVCQFPDTSLVLAHWGGGLPFYALMPEVAEALKHVYFDTAASPFLYTPEVFPVVARLLGPKGILFGSDYPLLKPERLLRQIRESGLSQEDQDRILGGNAQELLHLEGL